MPACDVLCAGERDAGVTDGQGGRLGVKSPVCVNPPGLSVFSLLCRLDFCLWPNLTAAGV